ncbi:MAG: YbbR-like domain-containing protein [Tannerella sp.]|jgi:hypothetical protein|nr:YbbR-like domain-containing protein [Tannerella sp.]
MGVGAGTFFGSFLRKINVFFRRQGGGNMLIFICFLLLSAGFWYLESLQDEYEIAIVIPVRYRNTPNNVILDDDNPQQLSVRVRDKGTILVNYMWFNSFAPIDVDLKDIVADNRREMLVDRRTIESAVSRQLISSTQLIAIEPQTIDVNFTALMHKDIRVVPVVDLKTLTGFQLSGAITANPAKVDVYGDMATLDSLVTVETEMVELKKADKTVTVSVKLKKIDKVQFATEKVDLTIPVEAFTEKRLAVPVKCSDLPANYILRVFPSSVEVVCNVPLSKYKDLDESDFDIALPFVEYETNRSAGNIPVRLTRQPDLLSPPTINPAAVEFILEQKP